MKVCEKAMKSERVCYQCGKEIADIPGKYFCSRECWEKWGSIHYRKNHKSIKEIQKRLLQMAKNKPLKEKEDIDKKIDLVKEVFDIK